MKIFKNIKIILITTLLILISIILIFYDFILYGGCLLVISLIIAGLWNSFIRKKDEKVDELESENETLKTEIVELKSQKLNILGIKDILELGLKEIDTKLTRTWNQNYKLGGKTVHFIGALEVKVIAKYGIDVKDLKIYQDKSSNIVKVANVNPKFLSFNDLDYDWKICELKEFKQPILGSDHWRTTDQLKSHVSGLQEKLRKETHQQMVKGPEELDWVINPLKEQVIEMIRLMLNLSSKQLEIVDKYDETFISLDQYSGDRKLLDS